MPKKITLRKKWLNKDFYYHPKGDYLRETINNYDESKLSGYRYKKIGKGREILIGVVKDEFVKKGEPQTVALAILRSKNVKKLKGSAKKMMAKFKKETKNQ